MIDKIKIIYSLKPPILNQIFPVSRLAFRFTRILLNFLLRQVQEQLVTVGGIISLRYTNQIFIGTKHFNSRYTAGYPQQSFLREKKKIISL
jgi:hypothetical protein